MEEVGIEYSSSSPNLPVWLQTLLSEKFYDACVIHHDVRKNEKNIFCLDCCLGICPHCLTPHGSHRLLQIRRYVYHDVIRVGDAEKLMDCSHVQSYTTNSAKVVFLNPRVQTRGCRNSSKSCISCHRALQDPYFFCSIYCKINHILRSEGMMSEYLYDCEVLSLAEPGSDDGLITPDSVISLWTSSGSSTSNGAAAAVGGGVDCRTILSTAGTTEIVRKKRSPKSAANRAAGCQPVTPPPSSEVLVNRRKGFPRRSPLN